MKKYESNKARKLLLASLVIPITLSMIPTETVHASTNDIPTINVYELNGSPKIEWATEMLESNIIIKTDFSENSMLPILSFGNIHGDGNQSYKIENHNRYLSVFNTMNDTGNLYYAPETSAKFSGFVFNDNEIFIPNGSYLSVAFKARSNNAMTSKIRQGTNAPIADNPVTLKDYNNNAVKFKETVDFRTSIPQEFSVYLDNGNPVKLTDGGLYYLGTSNISPREFGGIYYKWNQEKQKFISYDNKITNLFGVSVVKNHYFQPGENVGLLQWADIAFPNRDIISDNQWHTYNMNALISHDNYNFGLNGFKSRINWQTDGVLDIDDIKFGYATEVEVFRNGKSIYKGYLSDFHDTSARDNVAPNSIKSFNLSLKNNNELTFRWDKPKDNGVTNNYTIQSIDKNGIRSELSTPKSITITSDVIKYKYLVSKNPQDTPSIETSSNEFSLDFNQLDLVKDYLHIQAIDSNSNVSEVSSFKVTDLIDDEDSSDINDAVKKKLNTSFLLMEQGEFTLQTSDVKSFGQATLTAAKQTIKTGFEEAFGVIDARGTQEGWKVNVTASPFTEDTFDGFVGTPNQLPLGSLALKAPNSIERIGTTYKQDGLPTNKISDYTVIDNGAITLLSANKGEGLGQFKFSFDDDALALTVDATTAKIDNENYPSGVTPYTSTITWDLITGP